jgi:type IV pilus assembly protein PilE
MITRDSSAPASQAGFTLIELMVTIIIATILLTIAIPSYMSQIRQSRRTDARNAVLDAASREERYLSTANVYSQTPAQLGYSGAFPQPVGSNYYNLNIQAPDPSYAGTGPSYVITATAINSQLNDTACRSFSINQIGQQSSTTSAGAITTGSASQCWSN